VRFYPHPPFASRAERGERQRQRDRKKEREKQRQRARYADVSGATKSGHNPPTAYTGTSYTVLSASKNASHWQVNFLCTGCSTWGTTSLNPNGVNRLAYATSNRAPATPASNTSSITIHSEKGIMSQDLSVGKVDSNSFRRFVLFLSDHQQQQPSPGTDNAVREPADAPTAARGNGRIPTTIIRATATAVAPPPPPGDEPDEPYEPEPPTQRPGSSPGPVRTSITTVARPTPVTQRPITVTVTVTQPQQGGPGRQTTSLIRTTAKSTAKSTAAATVRTTTSCYRREGGSRVCSMFPHPRVFPAQGGWMRWWC